MRKTFKMKKIPILFVLSLMMAVFLSSCVNDKNNPGYAYMGKFDMYYTKYDKAYAPSKVLPNGQVNQPAPAGTVPRGASYFPYHPKNIGEKVADQNKAGVELKNPVAVTPESLTEGKRQYAIFCADCHGLDAKGDGHLYTAKLFPAKPRDLTGSYVQNMPDGSIFFIITEGSISGLMGPHGTQITPENRWKIVNYLRSIVKK
jgi:mono/diheme cytochrome c family protein